MAISCALVWFSASLPCPTVHCACCLYSNFLALPLLSSFLAFAAVELSCSLRSIDRRVAAAQGNLNYGCRFGEVLPIHNCNLNSTRLSLAFTGMRDSPHSSLPTLPLSYSIVLLSRLSCCDLGTNHLRDLPFNAQKVQHLRRQLFNYGWTWLKRTRSRA